jgi:hypothetical protein
LCGAREKCKFASLRRTLSARAPDIQHSSVNCAWIPAIYGYRLFLRLGQKHFRGACCLPQKRGIKITTHLGARRQKDFSESAPRFCFDARFAFFLIESIIANNLANVNTHQSTL